MPRGVEDALRSYVQTWKTRGIRAWDEGWFALPTQIGWPIVRQVLREVGLVEARREGRQMLYRVNAMAIRPLWEWTTTFERMWRHQLLKVKEIAEKKSGL